MFIYILKYKIKTIKTFIMFLLLFNNTIFSQNYLGIKSITVKDGLPSNNVYCVAEDLNGYIWIATDSGLSKYNGSYFKKFTKENGLPSNDILRIEIDKKNRVWVMGYYKGLFYIENDKIYNIKKAEKISNLRYSFTKNNIDYFYSVDLTKSYSFDGKNFKEVYVNSQNKTLVDYIDSENLIIGYDTKLNLFFCKNEEDITYTKKGYTYFRNGFYNKTTFIKILNKSNPRIHERKINGFLFSKNLSDTIYKNKIEHVLNTDFEKKYNIYFINNIYKIYFKGNFEKEMSSKLNALKSDLINIHSILIDNNKNFWVLFSNNELKFIPNNFLDFKINKLPNNLKLKSSAILDSSVYILDYNNNLKIFHKNKIENLKTFSKKRTREIKKNNKNELILFSGEGIDIFKIINNKISKHNSINELNRAVFQSENHIYTIENSIIKKDFVFLDSIKKNTRFNCIYFKDDIIYASNEELLYENNLKTNKKTFYNNFKEISCISSIKDYLILGTISDGLQVLDKTMKKVHNLEQNKNIYKILVDKNILIVASNSSLSVYDFNYSTPKLINTLNTSEDFQSKINSIQKINNDIYFSTSEEIVWLKNFTELKSINKKPNIEINHLRVNDSIFFNLKDLNKIKLERENNNLEFQVSIFDFNYDLKKIKKYYKLNKIGEKGKWRETKKQKIEFENLSPGEYEFQFKIENLKNEILNIKTIKLDIKYYYWEKISFLLFIISFSILIIILLVYYYYQKKLKQSKLKLRLFNLELKALKMQMSPHFIFNSLNNYQSIYVLEGESKANIFLEKFTALVRKTLEISNKDTINLDDEIVYLKNYVYLETLKSGIEVDFIIKKKFEKKIYIPVLLLQPIIENALKHAFPKGMTKNNRLLLKFEEKSNYLKIIIKDNGIGRKKSYEISNSKKNKHESLSNSIILERISLLNKASKLNNKISYKVEDVIINKIIKGTKVTFLIPINNT